MAKVEPFESNQERRSSHSGHGGRASQEGAIDHEKIKAASGPGKLVYSARHVVKDCFQRCGWYESATAIAMRKFLHTRGFTIATMLSLFVALFFVEIFTLAQVPSNTVLDIILTIVFAIFAFEFITLTITDASYLFGFFFWMDLLGTASLAFDISFLAGADVTVPFKVNRGDSSEQQNLIVVRATRAAKLGARTGRISRVLKVLRYLPFLLNGREEAKKVKMARVISNQLTNVLSIRVAFLTICLVIVMPLFTMFTYPEEDDSMGAWTELLALNAEEYFEAWQSGVGVASVEQSLLGELTRLRGFYDSVSYGPFEVAYGKNLDSGFIEQPEVLDLSGVDWTFSNPARGASSRIIMLGRIRASFDMRNPKQMESGMNIGLIVFILVVMLSFGMVMSSSISVIALQPLERMLSVVRERCTQIFKYTSDLKDSESDSGSDTSEEYDDMEHVSEFALLERVVLKLAAIAHLSATAKEPEVKANMTENEVMAMSWMQAPAMGPAREKSLSRPSAPKGRCGAGLGASESSDVEVPRKVGASSSLPMAIVEALETPDFNAFDLTKELKISVAAYLLTSARGNWVTWARNNVPEPEMWAFLQQVESQYTANPFHNFAHAIDVEYTVSRYMDQIDASQFMPETTTFCLLIASIAHDVGHMGVNNQYLMETAAEVALRYNDRSPLENMHCAKLFQIVSSPETNVFTQVEKDLYKVMRKEIIDVILHTDLVKHNEMVKECGMLYQMNSESFDNLQPEAAISSPQQIAMLCNLLLHGADVSNPMKPWELCQRLAYLCMDEFFAQGDLEKAAGLPVQMLNDRDKVNRPNAQIGFIEFFIVPMAAGMVQMFPQLGGSAEFLGENIQNWMDVWIAEVEPKEDAVAKVAPRVKKVADKMNSLVIAAEERRLECAAKQP